MTGLLVSVRDADEARDAVAAGTDLIDVKEPRGRLAGRRDAANDRPPLLKPSPAVARSAWRW